MSAPKPHPFAGVTMPPASATLGWRLIACDAKGGMISVGFEGKPEFANPAGVIQGGILGAMIDDAMSALVIAHTRAERFPSTIDLHVHYLRPVRPGPVRVDARISEKGRSVIFLEAELFESRGKRAARATASAALIEGVMKKTTES